MAKRIDDALATQNFALAEQIARNTGITVNTKSVTEIFNNVRETLDELKTLAMDAGIKIPNELEDYFPRILDYKKYREFAEALTDDIEGQNLILQNLNKFDELSELEKGEKIGKLIEEALAKKSIPPSQILDIAANRKPGSANVRKIDNEKYAELSKFYKPSEKAIIDHIQDVSSAIEVRRVLRKDVKDFDTLKSSVGEVILKLQRDGFDLSGRQIDDIRNLLVGLYGAGRKHPHSGLSKLTQLGIFSVLTDVMNTLTQVGDMVLAVPRYGLWNTATSIASTVGGKPLRSSKYVTLDDLDMNIVLRELHEPRGFASTLDKTLKWSGFKKIDRLGKQVVLNAAYKKLQQQARTGKGYDKLKTEYERVLQPDELNNALKSLKEGRLDDPNAKFMVANQLLDLQPLTMGDMPIFYAQHPNLRWMWSLKSYSANILNLMRRDVVREMAAGRVGTATGRLGKYAATLAAGNGSVALIKDVIKSLVGDQPITADEEWMDHYVDGMMGAGGVNRYMADSFSKDPLRASADYITPVALKVMWDGMKDPQKMIRLIPVTGDLTYEYFKARSEEN